MSGWYTPPTVVPGEVGDASDFNNLSNLVSFVGNPAQGSIYVNGSQGIANNAWTNAAFNMTSYMLNGMGNGANGQLVIPYDGLYFVSGHFQFAALTTNVTSIACAVYSNDAGAWVKVGDDIMAYEFTPAAVTVTSSVPEELVISRV